MKIQDTGFINMKIYNYKTTKEIIYLIKLDLYIYIYILDVYILPDPII